MLQLRVHVHVYFNCYLQGCVSESSLVACVAELEKGCWLEHVVPINSASRLTLLHMCAMLGYQQLLQALLAWKYACTCVLSCAYT